MVKLTAQGYELLPPGRYVLEVVEAEPVTEYGPQLRLRLRVAEGEHEGFEFVDYPNRGAEDGVKVSTKAWDIYEACLDRHIAPDEVLDAAAGVPDDDRRFLGDADARPGRWRIGAGAGGGGAAG